MISETCYNKTSAYNLLPMKSLIFWIIIVLAGIWVWKDGTLLPDFIQSESVISQSPTKNISFSLTTSEDWSDDVIIPIAYNWPIEFDGMTREQIMELRKDKIDAYKELINGEYVYSKKVFGQIQDRRPWWGLEGQFCYGPGDRSTEGLSEESRFIMNPYLLLMINNSSAYVSNKPECTAVLPGPPLSSTYYPKQNRLEITYDMNRFLVERSNMHGFLQSKEISIVGMNALDFGFSYVYFDPQYTSGVSSIVGNSAFREVQKLKDFIHLGRSCGYPNGCNNGSPNQPEIYFTVNSLPAYIHAKLWKNRPYDKNSEPDFSVNIALQ